MQSAVPATQLASSPAPALSELPEHVAVFDVSRMETSMVAYQELAKARLAGKTVVLAQRGVAPSVGAVAWRPAPARGGWVADLAHLLFALFEECSEAERATLRAGFFAQIEQMLSEHILRFYRGGWATSVKAGSLNRAQYVATLQNMHQYVRFTTRLLGRAVACSPTTKLRSHFAAHLSGEVNHELLIERDLQALGEDVAFLRDHRYPNRPTRWFMSIEQSLVSFECDPILFVACPLAAEAISAKMDGEFLKDLRRSVARFADAPSEKVTTFFTSHIETDGGDDGHWELSRKLLQEGLPNEAKLGEFLVILDMAAASFTDSFNQSAQDYAFLSA